MADTIEISNNTLLKLKIRSGTDLERKNVVLDNGEPGYSTDTKRLYIGDSSTPGGNLTGNVFNGARVNVTNPGANTPQFGDYAFDTTEKALYIYNNGPATSKQSWYKASHPVYSADNTITIVDGQVSVGIITENNLSNSIVGSSIVLDESNKISLPETILIGKITSTSPYLILPSQLEIGTQQYSFPSTINDGGFLQVDATGNLTWNSVTTSLTGLTSTDVSVGEGLELYYNDVQVSQASLLSGGNVHIKATHIPTSTCSFRQNGALTRTIGVSSVDISSKSVLDDYGVTYNGMHFDQGTSALDNATATGVYRITLNEALKIDTSDVSVRIDNGSYYAETLSQNRSEIITCSPELSYGYVIIPSTSNPTTFNSIIVYIYSTKTRANRQGGGWLTKPLPPILTSGYNNTITSFKVDVYGDLAP